MDLSVSELEYLIDNVGADILTLRRKDGVWGLLVLPGTNLFLHEDGRSRVPSPEAMRRALAEITQLNKGLTETSK